MATWMEIRCDVQEAPTAYDRKCWSNVNAGPMDMAGDTQASVVALLRDLHAQALKQRWQRVPEGWACPHCADLRNQTTAGLVVNT